MRKYQRDGRPHHEHREDHYRPNPPSAHVAVILFCRWSHHPDLQESSRAPFLPIDLSGAIREQRAPDSVPWRWKAMS